MHNNDSKKNNGNPYEKQMHENQNKGWEDKNQLYSNTPEKSRNLLRQNRHTQNGENKQRKQ